MAARLRTTHQEDVRKKIQASQLINFLQNHALKGDSEVAQSRIDAAKFLLNKSIANPATDNNVNHSGTVKFGWMS